jgi:hypothetical protein
LCNFGWRHQPSRINWSLDKPTLTINEEQLEESFCDFVDDDFLQQFITRPTNTGGNTVDLLL